MSRRANQGHPRAHASTQGKPERNGRRSNGNRIGKHGHADEKTPGRSTRGVVDITQDVGLKLQILQSILDDIANADDTGQLAVA